MTEMAAQLALALEKVGTGPVWVHSDLLAARGFVPTTPRRDEMLNRHHQLLLQASEGRQLWTVCFNYDYTKTAMCDLRHAPCHVGPLGEFVRNQPGVLRSFDPVFSVCIENGQAPPIPTSTTLKAFGEDTMFAQLHEHDGALLFYGAPFSSATFIHFAELQAGGPAYRYDKTFGGTLVDQSGHEHPVQYEYHVRPWGEHLDYDWPRLQRDAEAAGLFAEVRYREQVVSRIVSARDLTQFWLERLAEDRLYLLDGESRTWVEPRLEELGRRFVISDFE